MERFQIVSGIEADIQMCRDQILYLYLIQKEKKKD